MILTKRIYSPSHLRCYLDKIFFYFFFLFFFYMTVSFNIMYWVNAFQSFLWPLKTLRCCRSFVSPLTFRCWKSFLIMSIQQVFLLLYYFLTLRRYSESAFFAGASSWSHQSLWNLCRMPTYFGSITTLCTSLSMSQSRLFLTFRPVSFGWQYRMLLTCLSSL